MDSILTGKQCPYCGSKTEYIDSSFVYGRSYGMMYICKPCDAYVGVHKGTDKAKGRLANAELRELKKEAHYHFDKLWKEGDMKRSQAYKWLANQLNINPKECHIGMMNNDRCKRVIELLT